MTEVAAHPPFRQGPGLYSVLAAILLADLIETGRRTSPVIRADELVQVEIECNVNHDSLGINSRVLDGSIADATLQVPITGSRSLDRFAPLSTFLVSSGLSVSSDRIAQVS